ncbi:MAG TPA: hypothetical protein VF461_07845 [Gemmatimonadaceae bacterium]
MPVTLPPYALSAPVFRFRHLAALAGRAPIGGAREVALACFVAARLVSDCCDPALELDEPALAARCAGAKGWLGTIAIPSPVRTPVAKLAEASATASPAAMAPLVSSLANAAESFLDAASRSELDVLAARLASMAPLTPVSHAQLVASH